jgi:PAS domain S-box-containing protein
MAGRVSPPKTPKAKRTRRGSSDETSKAELLVALRALRDGDASVRLPRGVAGPDDDLAEAFNAIAGQMAREPQRREEPPAVEDSSVTPGRGEAQWSTILQSLPIVIHSRSIDSPFAAHFVSDAVAELTGFPASRFVDEPEFATSRVHPDDLDVIVQRVSDAVRLGHYSVEFRWLCADGHYKVLHDQGVLAPSVDGRAREIFGVLTDATERRAIEQRLTQAREMEAVGQLTGGIAHDFNNLLTVVLGNIDIMARKTEDEARRARRIDAVRQAAERGRDLTRQLLAFSRRQHLSPISLNLNNLIADIAPLLRQALGEAATLNLLLADDALCAHIDPGQLQTALLHLAENARDAMPEGGSLAIVTRREGRDVVIEISDTGVGMSPEVRDRVFEPFFTTKEVGRGSGLGLSQVYGFVRQSGGEIDLRSAPGQGAIFVLRLPHSEEPAAQAEADPSAAAVVEGGHERILLVEDDATVLSLTLDMLTGLGYQVTTATNAAEALAVIQAQEDIDILFSDVVMPGGVSGVSLAHTARELRGNLKVLLTSGFVGDSEGLGSAAFPLLDKPYEISQLSSKLRKLLDSPHTAGCGCTVAAGAAE